MTSKRLCCIDGCDKPSRKRKMCAMHYTRWRIHGDPSILKIQQFAKGEPMEWLLEHTAYTGTECLKWPFGKGANGYGGITLPSGETIGTHRFMCMLVNGEPPTDKHVARHKCGKGNDGCVNPNHLEWGTPQENVDDRAIHGTNPSGERSGKTRFTAEEINFVRSLKGQMPYKDIAVLFGVDASWVSRVMSGKRWKDW